MTIARPLMFVLVLIPALLGTILVLGKASDLDARRKARIAAERTAGEGTAASPFPAECGGETCSCELPMPRPAREVAPHPRQRVAVRWVPPDHGPPHAGQSHPAAPSFLLFWHFRR